MATEQLVATPEPVMKDATNKELLSEIEGPEGWRIALSSCNKDKATTVQLINTANKEKSNER